LDDISSFEAEAKSADIIDTRKAKKFIAAHQPPGGPIMSKAINTASSFGHNVSRSNVRHDVIGVISEMYYRWVQRRHLQDLDDRMLSDMGLTRADVNHEAGKPFWRV
jgi:uncharacterized protein YjiS (DUF1127 family)